MNLLDSNEFFEFHIPHRGERLGNVRANLTAPDLASSQDDARRMRIGSVGDLTALPSGFEKDSRGTGCACDSADGTDGGTDGLEASSASSHRMRVEEAIAESTRFGLETGCISCTNAQVESLESADNYDGPSERRIILDPTKNMRQI